MRIVINGHGHGHGPGAHKAVPHKAVKMLVPMAAAVPLPLAAAAAAGVEQQREQPATDVLTASQQFTEEGI